MTLIVKDKSVNLFPLPYDNSGSMSYLVIRRDLRAILMLPLQNPMLICVFIHYLLPVNELRVLWPTCAYVKSHAQLGYRDVPLFYLCNFNVFYSQK